MRRILVFMAVAALVIAAGGYVFSHFLQPRLFLRVAIGGDAGSSQRFMQALAPLLSAERSRVRFRYVAFSSTSEAAQAMERGAIDLMIARSDIAPVQRGRTIVIMRRSAVALILPVKSGVENIADLAGKTVIIPVSPSQAQNEVVLDQLLDFYSVPRSAVSRIFAPAADAGRLIREKRAQAVFSVGPYQIGPLPEAADSIRRYMKEAPSIKEIAEAKAVVSKLSRFEAVEMPRGAISGNPAIPDEAVDTLALPVRLLAANTLSSQLVADIARVITTRKATLADMVPGASQIEAPDVEDKSTALPVHPGAIAYFSGEQENWFDRIESFIYAGALLLSLLGSLAAWFMGNVRRVRHGRDEVRQRIDGLLDLISEAPTANSERRAAIALEVETQADWALRQYTKGEIDAQRYQVVEAVVRRARERLGVPISVRQRMAAE